MAKKTITRSISFTKENFKNLEKEVIEKESDRSKIINEIVEKYFENKEKSNEKIR